MLYVIISGVLGLIKYDIFISIFMSGESEAKKGQENSQET